MKAEVLLKPVNECGTQAYLGRGLHTFGVIEWLLAQTGPSDIIISTFSTSIEFLSAFYNLRKKGLVRSAKLIADLKASKKTYRLDSLMRSCFEQICLAENHSKVVLLSGGAFRVAVHSSQNNTYGGRAECTLVTTNAEVFNSLHSGLTNLINNSLKMNGR
jgi:hypothetical protein